MRLFLDFILAAGITVTGIVLFLILKQKRKQLPQYIMIFFFAVLFLIITNLYASIHHIDVLWEITYVPHDAARWLLGPVLFLYIKSLFLKKETVFKDSILHFIPAILYILLVSIPVLWHSIAESSTPTYLAFYTKHATFFGNVSNGHTLFYLLISYTLLLKFKTKIKANYASFSGHDLNWINHVLIGGCVILSFDIGIHIYGYIFEGVAMNPSVFSIIILIFFITYLGYYGMHQSKILLPDFLLEKNGVTVPVKNEALSLSSISEAELLELKHRVEYLLETKKMYLDEELTLIKLAEQIPITDKKLSALLNSYMKVSFYDIINSYRVAAVKEKIASKAYENLSLLGIAYECGFRSKASFNRIFKKETGFSPSQYKNHHRKD